MNREEAVRLRRAVFRREKVISLVEGAGNMVIIGGATAGYAFWAVGRTDLAAALGMGVAAVTGVMGCRQYRKQIGG
ncbi:MAG: hypothetical protein WCT01_04075 [Candidatus Shapirobacteria bacterium]